MNIQNLTEKQKQKKRITLFVTARLMILLLLVGVYLFQKIKTESMLFLTGEQESVTDLQTLWNSLTEKLFFILPQGFETIFF